MAVMVGLSCLPISVIETSDESLDTVPCPSPRHRARNSEFLVRLSCAWIKGICNLFIYRVQRIHYLVISAGCFYSNNILLFPFQSFSYSRNRRVCV